MSYHNNNGNIEVSGNTYTSSSFVKEKDGVVAPAGFHYMPNGKLMSDADHIAVNGYIEKKITGFNINAQDISYDGESRAFTVNGNNGAVFGLEIYDDADVRNYYNFNTNTWSTSKAGLNNIELTGSYTFSIKFPTIEFTDATCVYDDDEIIAHADDGGKIKVGMTVTGSGIPAGATVASVANTQRFDLSVDTTGGAVTNGTLAFGGLLKKYTIDLHAKTVDNIKTKHTTYSEVRNLDNTVNINKSTGSNSDLLRKTIYQDVKKNLYLSCIAPSLTDASADVVASFVGSADPLMSRVIITNGNATDPNVVQVGDKVTGTGVAAEIHALVTKINPDGDNAKELEINANDDIGDGVAINFTPAFNGVTPSPATPAARTTLSTSSGNRSKHSFSITVTALAGRAMTLMTTPTIDHLCTYKTVTFGADPIVIAGEDISGGAGNHFGWPVDNVTGLTNGMSLDPARTGTGLNTTTPATISNYNTTETIYVLGAEDDPTSIVAKKQSKLSINGVNPEGNPITAIDRNDFITAQAGNIIFSKQQANALKADSGVRIFGYGQEQISSLTNGVSVALSNMSVTSAQISTTTSGAVNGSTTIGLDEVGNICSASTIRGVGIDSTAANPTVSVKFAIDGAANITASAAQTLEDNQTLYFDGASNVLTITGDIEVLNMGISDTTLYFDLEKFIRIV